MPLTPDGFEARRFPEIQEAIRSQEQTNLATPISNDPDTVIAVFNAIIANAIAVQENNTQALSNNLDINKAEGIYLDRLVRYVGIERFPARPASGQLKVWRNITGNLSGVPLFADTQGNQYRCPNGLSHNLSNCAEVTLTPIPVLVGNIYTVTINTATFTTTADNDSTPETIVNTLAQAINASLGNIASNVNNALLIVGPDSDLNSLNIARNGFSITEVGTFNFCESVAVGSLQVQLDTITSVVTNDPTITRVNNPVDFLEGRDVETDEQLRARQGSSVAQGGAATLPAIQSALLQVNNVQDVFIIENRTLMDDPDGRPPKSYETIVVGGNPDQIAQEIWNTKPAGIETYGQIQTPVSDFSNQPQSVNWSRPENIYIFVRVTYELYDEEAFPTNGEDLMQSSILSTGQALSLDNDVIPQRFIGPIYASATGIGPMTVEVGFSTNVDDTSPSSGYFENTIPISPTQFPFFSEGRIEVVKQP